MQKKIIIGNWKMNKNIAETRSFFEEFYKANINLSNNVEYGIAVPFTNMILASILKKPNFILASQDVSQFESGAHTGEISPAMLDSLGTTHVIVGHSERRKFNHESNDDVNKKAINCLNNGLTPIICVGEDLIDYENNNSKEIIKNQVLESTKNINNEKIIIAYEPIWAIGTGKTATPEYANEICKYIKSLTSINTKLLYGGSVNENNIGSFLTKDSIDGALVGNASLDVNSFLKLIKNGDV